MELDFFNSEKMLRLTPVVRESTKIANEILSGEVSVFPKLSKVKVKRLSELWERKFEATPSTYALYVYALYPVSYLLNAYEVTEDSCYLSQALKLSLDFLDWESRGDKRINKKRMRILFGDHAISNRTRVLCYLACCLRSEGQDIPSQLVIALIKNGEYLSDIKNYSHYNHGLMMDLSLLSLLNTLEGLRIEYPSHYKVNLIARLRHSITRDLTEDGVHIENSPGYHFWMLGFLDKITNSLKTLDAELYSNAKTSLGKSYEYAKYITRPDGSVPAIGDTHSGVKYKPTKGLGSKYFRYANQVIFRSQTDSVWAHFASGYKTHVHKHCDNGSFILYSNGNEVFVDPGFLSFEKDEDSLRIKGSDFHNVVKPKNSEQIISPSDILSDNKSYINNSSDSKIIHYNASPEAEVAKARISEYSEGSIERTVVWFKPNAFFIYDMSNEVDEIRQVFNLADGLDVRFSKDFISVFDSDENEVCKIYQFDKNCLFNKDVGVIVSKGYVANALGSKSPNLRLFFDSNNGRFFTLIELPQGKLEESAVVLPENVADVDSELRDFFLKIRF